MSCDVATWADTSSNQASKDPSKLHRGYRNLGKIYRLEQANSLKSQVLRTRRPKNPSKEPTRRFSCYYRSSTTGGGRVP
jgi:hypothetical protein